MELLLIRHLWGTTGTWEHLFARFREAGYRGIEGHVPASADRERFQTLLQQQDLRFIPQIFTHGAVLTEHLDSFRQQLTEAVKFSPLLVNAHSGVDAWDEGEATRFFVKALAIEAELGVPVAHETHRGRILFNPWVTRRMLERFPNLRLCCDFSHWVCVAERLIDDQIEIIRQAAARCIHLHARVGYEQGPQVPDPRAPEYARHLAAHERWWQMIWEAQEARGDAATTLTPEFGPPGYLHTLPYTNVPVSDLGEICDWQAQRQAAHFRSRTRTGTTGM